MARLKNIKLMPRKRTRKRKEQGSKLMPILHWLNREKSIREASFVPYRLLKADSQLSYGDPESENMLIQGDNLEALKALLPYYAGKVKCIYIDPPYNTKSAFESYEDSLEHSKWLDMMYPRLEILWELLKNDGVIMISINNDEGHYLKVMCDEIFGRKNFISSLVWHYEGNTDNQATIINYHEYIHLYSKNGKIQKVNTIDPNIGESSKLNKSEIRNTIVKNGSKNPVSPVVLPKGFPANFENGVIKSEDVNWPRLSTDIIIKNFKLQLDVEASSGWSSKRILESFIDNKFHSVSDSKGQKTTFELTRTGAIEVVKKRNQEKGHFISVLRGFGTTNQMRVILEKMDLRFSYPKPVDLISYLAAAFTSKDDVILDSFAGSGTTAHAILNLNKQEAGNRKFILIEMNEDSACNLIPKRLRHVIDGHKKADLVATGGGYRFYHLGEAIFDEDGQINPEICFEHLAAHIWFSETRIPYTSKGDSPLLGIHNGKAYYLLYNGILGDKRPQGGNVLTSKILQILPEHRGLKVIYGETTRLGPARLEEYNITFKQTPYDIKAC